MDVHEISMNCKRTEFVGTAVLDTIGLCIAGVDDTLLKTMNIGTRYHALGLFRLPYRSCRPAHRHG